MDIKFLTPLDVRDRDDHVWTLLAPFIVEHDKTIDSVPAGFETDFASVPRLPVTFMLFGNIGHRAATWHDWAYKTGAYPREECDAIFRELLIAEGVSTFRAYSMYIGVRVGGESHYKGKK